MRHLSLALTLAALAALLGACPASTDPADGDTNASATAGTDGCPAYCAQLHDCDQPDASECDDLCPSIGQGYDFIGAECLALYAASNSCHAGLTCDQFAANPGPCDDADAALMSESCTTQSCRDLCAKAASCGAGDGDGLSCAVQCSFATISAFVSGGEACADAIEALQACERSLTCDQLDDEMSCASEQAAIETACVE